MIGRPPNACVKCGHGVPQGAGFCPNCGTAVHDIKFNVTSDETPETLLPSSVTGPASTKALPSTKATTEEQAGVDNAPTIGLSGIATSLDNPSKPPGVRAGDGPFQPGQQAGPRYTILKLLGTGGMGAVYQAFDHELGVAVAIKVIRPAAQSDATAAKDLEQRFKRELVLARQVTHKHVVRIHDLGEIDGIKYLTMPFIDGDTLSTVMRRAGTLPLARVIAIAQQIAHGLAAAHEKGVIHRDLKPENIMIERQMDEPIATSGDALIMDFGIARSMEAGDTQTAAGSVIGTLEYMAPEQAHGKKCDQRCDHYSFGLIIYDMLLGRHRMASTDNVMAGLLARIAAPPPSPRSVNPEIPEPLDQIVMRCLQPNPDARFANTLELVNALDRLTPEGYLRLDVHEIITVKSRPVWHLAAAGVLTVALAGTAAWVMSSRGGGIATSEVREPVSVLIGDFDNKTGDAVFDGVVEQAISLGVEGASFINVYPRRDALRIASTIKQGRLDEETATLVAIREGLGTVVVGEIEPKASGYLIRIRGVGPDGKVRYTLEGDAASKADVLATVGDLAGRVRLALGDTVAPTPADAFTAASLEAASAYARAQEFQALGRREDAIKMYEEAIKLDPEFGRAYSGLAANHDALGRPAEAEANYQMALQRIDRMNDREKFRTRGIYYMFARKPELAVPELQSLLQAYPFDSTGLTNLALARFYLRELTEALEIGRKAADLQPNNVGRRTNVALYAMYGGQFEAAMSESDAARKINPATLKAFVARALSEVALGRTADAIKTYEELEKISADGASFASSGLADVAALEGRHAEAIAILDAGIAADEERKNIVRAAGKRVARAEMHLALGNSAAAIRDAQAAISSTPDNNVKAAAGLLLARAGRRDEAQKIAESLEARLEADFQAYGKLVRTEIALAQNQGRQAFELARDAEKIANTWLGHLMMARAYLLLDAFPEADSQLDIAMKRQGEATALFLDDVPTYRYFTPVHYYKGRAQEGLKSASATASYKTFLGFSKTGEGALAADARARLAKLGS